MSVGRLGVLVASSAAGLLLAGCVPTMLSGRVSSELVSTPASRATFFVAGADRSGIGVTERQIQRLIADEMMKLGFVATSSRDSADLAVLYSYNVGEGRTQVSSSPDFVWGGQKVESHTEYPRSFQIAIVDSKASQLPDRVKMLWQGELFSTGSTSDIAVLANHFVSELFRNFGRSETNRRFRRLLR